MATPRNSKDREDHENDHACVRPACNLPGGCRGVAEVIRRAASTRAALRERLRLLLVNDAGQIRRCKAVRWLLWDGRT